jgi:flagellar biosynthetic protein FliS
MSAVMKQKYQAYAAATQTVAGTRQVVMLYDGAIRFVQQAKEAIRERRIEDRYNLLMKASGIVSGLQNCLDFERGGKIAKISVSILHLDRSAPVWHPAQQQHGRVRQGDRRFKTDA